MERPATRAWGLLLLFLLLLSFTSRAQNQPDRLRPGPRLWRATAVPAVLVGYGLSVVGDHGWYSSEAARGDVRRHFSGFRTSADDYLQWAPYAVLGAALALGEPTRTDRPNLALVVVKSEALMLGSVYLLKTTTRRERPDGSDTRSFPSGHTAQAFLAASILDVELRGRSRWYGIGAYTVATSVGALRMLNDKHWQADVFAGAGLGILSAHLTYLTHRYRWGRRLPARAGVGALTPARPAWQLRPAVGPGGELGFCLSWAR